jgi:hypothetical protein
VEALLGPGEILFTQRVQDFLASEQRFCLVEKQKGEFPILVDAFEELIRDLIRVFFLAAHKHHGIGEKVEIFGHLPVLGFDAVQVGGVHQYQVGKAFTIVDHGQYFISHAGNGIEINFRRRLAFNSLQGEGELLLHRFDAAVMEIQYGAAGLGALHSGGADHVAAQRVETGGFADAGTA